MSDIISYLFQTDAIKFCKENEPFWYTSGKIGPYFINTHFIYGNETDAKELLSYIDAQLVDKMALPGNVFKKVLAQYQSNTIYKDVIDTMITLIQQKINIDEIDYISGGERRDWFFSNIIAHLLNKPHISIYKDLTAVVSDSHFETSTPLEAIEGKKVLHVADLMNVASSYLRAWIPAIETMGGTMCWSCVVVDRMQGGTEKVKEKNVVPLSLVQVDKSLFTKAVEMNVINPTQQEMLNNFFENPDETMRQFLRNHPEFLENSLKADDKTAKRAKLLIDGNLYHL